VPVPLPVLVPVLLAAGPLVVAALFPPEPAAGSVPSPPTTPVHALAQIANAAVHRIVA
jgi:hypothetical protein